jgi:hypothetical protein
MNRIKFNIKPTSHSIIPRGVLHKENHKIPQEYEMGGKGIPVASCTTDGCEKIAEVEKEELTVPKETAEIIESLSYAYLQSEDPRIAIKLGMLIHDEIKNNTIDHTKSFLSPTKSGNKVKSTTAPKSKK